MAKEYTVIRTRGRTGKKSETTGTVEELVQNYSYTLLSGHSYNSKINRTPTTAKSLVSNLNKSIAETQKGSYSPDYYELKEQ